MSAMTTMPAMHEEMQPDPNRQKRKPAIGAVKNVRPVFVAKKDSRDGKKDDQRYAGP